MPRHVCVYSNSHNDIPRVAQRYGTIAAHTRRRASVRMPRQVFSYLSGSRGRLIWEKELANFQNWENWIGETKQSILLLNHSIILNHSKACKTIP